MFRVYNKKEKTWEKDYIYMSSFGNLYKVERGIFGKLKLNLLSRDEYVYHRDTGLYDKNGILIYEGDIVEAQISLDKTVIGLVTYVFDIASYIILDYESSQYYTIGTEKCKYVRIVGNIFDNPNTIRFDKGESNEEMSKENTTEKTDN